MSTDTGLLIESARPASGPPRSVPDFCPDRPSHRTILSRWEEKGTRDRGLRDPFCGARSEAYNARPVLATMGRRDAWPESRASLPKSLRTSSSKPPTHASTSLAWYITENNPDVLSPADAPGHPQSRASPERVH